MFESAFAVSNGFSLFSVAAVFFKFFSVNDTAVIQLVNL